MNQGFPIIPGNTNFKSENFQPSNFTFNNLHNNLNPEININSIIPNTLNLDAPNSNKNFNQNNSVQKTESVNLNIKTLPSDLNPNTNSNTNPKMQKIKILSKPFVTNVVPKFNKNPQNEPSQNKELINRMRRRSIKNNKIVFCHTNHSLARKHISEVLVFI